MSFGCILYADDILLLSPTAAGSQQMLDKCSEIAEVISLEFNVEKCHCIAIGKKTRNSQITPMSLCGNPVEWCETIKYLGVYLQVGSSVRFDVSYAKRAFYAACMQCNFST